MLLLGSLFKASGCATNVIWLLELLWGCTEMFGLGVAKLINILLTVARVQRPFLVDQL